MQSSKVPIKFFWPIVVMVVTAAIVALLMLTKPKPESKPSQEQVWQVKAMEVSVGTHSPKLSLLGQLQSPSLVVLTAAVEADVVEVLIADGQFVEKGQTLVVLDDREAKQRLAQRRGELNEAKAQLAGEKARYANDKAALKHEQTLLELSAKTAQRLEKLARQDLGARSQLDEALQSQAKQQLTVQVRRYQIEDHDARLAQINARINQAKARVELAKLEVERTHLVAPFNGRISQRHVASGQRVRVGEALVELYAVNQLEVIAQIPWARHAVISELLAKQGSLSAITNDEQALSLTLSRLAGQVEAGQGGVEGSFTLVEEKSSLPLGYVANIELSLPAEENTVIIPYEALYGLNKIYRIVDERLLATEVTVLGEAASRENTRYVVVSSNELADGDQVLITKFANAMEGLRVRVTP